MSVTVARPVVYRIERALFDRVNRLAAGWSSLISIREVIIPKRINTSAPRHNQIIIERGENVRVPDNDIPGNPVAIARTQEFLIRCLIIPSEKDPTPYDEYCEVAAAEIQRVIGEPNYWWTFGGLAINSEWGDPVNIDGGQDQVGGVVVPLVVLYRTDENDPYTVRA
jgi:hypothetical protein